MAFETAMGKMQETDYENRISLVSRKAEMCAEAFGDVIASLFDLTPVATGNCTHVFSFEDWFTDRFGLAVVASSPAILRRSKKHIQDISHLLVACRYLEGGDRGLYEGEALERKTGPIYVVDQEQICEMMASAYKCQFLYIPKSELGYHPDLHARNLIIERDTTTGRLVHACMDKLFDPLKKLEQSLSAAAVDQFFACLKIAMGTNPKRGDVRTHARAALFEQICQYIETNLGAPSLSTEALLRQFGVSRASLYRMFEDKGGVRNYITERRALRAILDIANAPHRRGQISMAAADWGFSTMPNFNRAIKRLYGAPPSALFRTDASTGHELDDDRESFSRFLAEVSER